MLSEQILERIAEADTERILRAINGLEDGTLAVTITTLQDDTVTAVVKSTGKVYTVFLSPSHLECSCRDYFYRAVVCKHLVDCTLWLEREAEALQAPALARISEDWHERVAA